MTGSTEGIVIEARHTARLVASREQVLAAELDPTLSAEAWGQSVRDIVHDARGTARSWRATARAGLLRQTFTCTLESTDPVVIRAQRAGQVQISTTLVGEPDPVDGLTPVDWHVRVELSPRRSGTGWLLRAAAESAERDLAKRVARTMPRWAATIESRVARGEGEQGGGG